MGGCIRNAVPTRRKERWRWWKPSPVKGLCFWKAGFSALPESHVSSRGSREGSPNTEGAHNQQLGLKLHAFISHYSSSKLNPSFLLQGKGLPCRWVASECPPTGTSVPGTPRSHHARDCKPVGGHPLGTTLTPTCRTKDRISAFVVQSPQTGAIR